MCGICGEVTFNGAPADPAALARMMEALAPRGPDANGMVVRGRTAFGHQRLKIIDLTEKAQQPMIDSDLGLTIVFNGCIYNYPDLRAELAELGYTFFSHGDTEVICKAWHAWGPDCVKRFHGMFAFAIAERDSGRVILARDRFGIKPLYYAQTNGTLRFASSLPAIVAAGNVDTTIDPVALHHYMSFHAVVPPPHTILQGVSKLPPATLRIIEADGDTRGGHPPAGPGGWRRPQHGAPADRPGQPPPRRRHGRRIANTSRRRDLALHRRGRQQP